ncbi:MAG: hypothetical protein MAG794_01099 [Gammaproteobacteria bacterium]|nr:hypothetical protein [Gammaproteobacteria bacterium]
MLTKIFVTILVILSVITFYRFKNADRAGTVSKRLQARSPADNRFGRMLAYGFVGVLILVSSVWYVLHWREQHRVITIRVIGDSGTSTYQAYYKDLEGHRFESIDGKTVILGQSERVEIIGKP